MFNCLSDVLPRFFVIKRLPPRSTRTYTFVPYTTLFLSPRSRNLPLAGRRHHLEALGIPANYGTMHRLTPVAEPTCLAHAGADRYQRPLWLRSEEHTSELQSLMRISYAVFCLKKKNIRMHLQHHHDRI